MSRLFSHWFLVGDGMKSLIITLMPQLCAASLLALASGCGQSPPSIAGDGGYIIVYEHDDLDSDLAELRNVQARVIRGRLDPESTRGVRVRLLDKNQIEVSIPGIDSSQLEQDQKLIVSEGIILFGALASEQDSVTSTTNTSSQRWLELTEMSAKSIPENAVRRVSDTGATEVLVITLTGEDLSSCEFEKGDGNVAHLRLQFAEDASRRLKELLTNDSPSESAVHPVMIVDDILYPCSIRSAEDGGFRVEGLPQDDLRTIDALAHWGQSQFRVNDHPVSIKNLQPQQ